MKTSLFLTRTALALASALLSTTPAIAANPAAAAAAAQSCPQRVPGIARFYWEVGDGNQIMASGQVGAWGVQDPDDSQFNLASASKLVWAAYVAQVRGPAGLNGNDLSYLGMLAGYDDKASCVGGQKGLFGVTVLDCFGQSAKSLMSSSMSPSSGNRGRFYYSGTQLQAQAALDSSLGVINANAEMLANRVTQTLGLMGRAATPVGFSLQSTQTPSSPLSYMTPLVGSTGKMSPHAYGAFLRAILRPQAPLAMRSALGVNPHCTGSRCPTVGSGSYTNPATPPLPNNQAWQYSAGHWIESDFTPGSPQPGDGAFSSPGEFGMYPWIDRSKRYYGLVARTDYNPLAYQASILCGQMIRRAFLGP